MSQKMPVVLISSTSEDLKPYRQAAGFTVSQCGCHPEMMEDFGARPGRTVDECRKKVRESDLVLLIVAFRRGWVPTPEQGGDGQRSITAWELEEARVKRKPVLALLANPDWPGHLWDADQEARDWVQRFRNALNQPAEFFSHEPEREHPREPLPVFQSKVRNLLAQWRMKSRRRGQSSEIFSGTSPGRPGADLPLADLESLLSQVVLPADDLLRAYRESAPTGWRPPSDRGDPADLARECARLLSAALPQSRDGSVPLLSFIRRLIGRLDHPEAAGLERWLRGHAEQLGSVGVSSDASPTRETHKTGTGSVHVLVQVSPLHDGAGEFIVKAWLMGAAGTECLLSGEEARVLDDIPDELNEIQTLLAEKGVDFDDVWIELLLPRELLCEAPDQWCVPLCFLEPIPVGVEHRVVVRSLERARLPRAYSSLWPRWETLLKHASRPCEVVEFDPECGIGPVVSIRGKGRGGHPLYTQLKDARQVVCVLLHDRPEAVPADPRTDVLNTLLEVGIPVVAWARAQPPDAEPGRVGLFGSEALGRLPDRVWCLRKEAHRSGDSGHAGRHLTLLWDDPTRASPDFASKNRLRPPGR
jgi:hypothetical protein